MSLALSTKLLTFDCIFMLVNNTKTKIENYISMEIKVGWLIAEESGMAYCKLQP